MTPTQIVARARKGPVPPLVLLLGPEAYERDRVKHALASTVPADAFTQHDMAEVSLAEVIDDARSLSLFAADRVIWTVNAEAALPRGRSEEEGDGETGSSDAAPLAAYAKDPTPGVALVFEASRFDFEGDDKRRQERVRKFYAAVPDVVELRRYSEHEARREAEALAAQVGFRIEPAALGLLVEALGADMARIAIEIEKLALYAGGRAVEPRTLRRWFRTRASPPSSPW